MSRHRPENIEATGEIPRTAESGWATVADPAAIRALADQYRAKAAQVDPLQLDIDDDPPPRPVGVVIMIAGVLTGAVVLLVYGWIALVQALAGDVQWYSVG